MGDVVKFKIPKPGEKHRGKGLCQQDFHKWEVAGETRFDVKQGKLLTLLRCTRCGATKSEAR
jgi:hypothetical protein